jgi:hypothetical protein
MMEEPICSEVAVRQGMRLDQLCQGRWGSHPPHRHDVCRRLKPRSPGLRVTNRGAAAPCKLQPRRRYAAALLGRVILAALLVYKERPFAKHLGLLWWLARFLFAKAMACFSPTEPPARVPGCYHSQPTRPLFLVVFLVVFLGISRWDDNHGNFDGK